MKKIIILPALAILLLLVSGPLLAKNKKSKKQTKFKIDFGLHVGNSSSYYDMDGELITDIKRDSAYSSQQYGDSLTNLSTKYIYDLQFYTFDLRFEYEFYDNLSGYIRLPYTMYNYVESDIIDYTDSTRAGDGTYYPANRTAEFNIADISLSQFDYYGMGLNYTIVDNEFYSAVNLEYRIPPGTHKGVFDDPDYEILSDGAIQFLAGAKLGYISKNSRVITNVSYNYRDEEFEDQLLINLLYAFSNVKKTELRFRLDYISSLAPYDNVALFLPRNSVVQEDIISFGLAFWAKLFDDIENEISYTVRLFGKNGRNQGVFSLITSFRF